MSRIKGIVVEIGGDTTGLDKALSGTNKNIRSTQQQLKDVERLLKLDPNNVELLAQKERLLAKNVQETTKKLGALKDAEKQVQKQFARGEASREQYEALQREIVATEQDLERLTRTADDAGDAMQDVGSSTAGFGDILAGNAIVEGASALISTLHDVAEETKEYRKIMASLDVSSEAAGFSADETSEAYKKLYGVLGDDQTAATTAANLQAVAWRQEDLLEWIDLTTGAWAKYGDSIPIDGLAESINETAKTGKVTGALADVLNWAGVSEDDFNEKLGNISLEAKRANTIMKLLSEQGLGEMGRAWQENNATLVESNKANSDMQDQLARLSETVEPFITTITSMTASALEFFNSLDGGIQQFLLIAPVAVAGIGLIAGAFHGVKAALALISANPIVLLIGAVTALVVFIATNTEKVKKIMTGLSKFLAKIFIGIADIAKIPLNGIIGMLNGIVSAVNWVIRKLNGISVENPFTGKRIGFSIPQIGTIPYLANGGTVLTGSAVVGEAGPELLTVSNGRTVVQPLAAGEAPRTSAGGFNFTQNIYSPRQLNAYEIYRQTQNQGRAIARVIRRDGR